MSTPLEFVERLDRISLARELIAQGESPERLLFATFLVEDRIAGDRPVLAGRFGMRVTDDGSQLVLLGNLDVDHAAGVEVRLAEVRARESARLVDFRTGVKTKDLGERSKVRLSVARAPQGPSSRAARLRTGSLWALIGERADTPCQPAAFEAGVLGTHLVRSSSPSLFHPGAGTWVLVKISQPDELYFAFDAATGDAEFFPKTPNEPNDAARALFYAL